MTSGVELTVPQSDALLPENQLCRNTNICTLASTTSNDSRYDIMFYKSTVIRMGNQYQKCLTSTQ